MMRVDPPQTPLRTVAGAPRREAPGRSFSLKDGAPAKTSVASAAPLATMEAILALQGEDDPAERRRRALRRGHDLLDGLDRLKAALLGGDVPAAALTELAALLRRSGEATGDPGLDDVIAHIELRVGVELAKLSPRDEGPGGPAAITG
jgi:hypothetical protein